MFCEEIFEGIKAKKAEGDAAQFEVIYDILTLSLLSSKSTFSQPLIEKCRSDAMRIW